METIPTPKANAFMSESIGEISAALSEFQGSVTQPSLNKEVSVKMKTGGKYGFKYADLYECVKSAAPCLKGNGLAISQLISERRLVTILSHKSGEWFKSELPLPAQIQDYQALGSAITYLKRYAYCAILGLAADTDDDANTACGNDAQFVGRQPTYEKEIAEALNQLECCNTRGDAQTVWNDWQRKCPQICQQGSAFLKAVSEKIKTLPVKLDVAW